MLAHTPVSCSPVLFMQSESSEVTHDMSGTLPPLEARTADNNGPVVVLVAYIGLAFVILSTALRWATTFTKKKGVDWDDTFLLLAAVRASVSFSARKLCSDAQGNTVC